MIEVFFEPHSTTIDNEAGIAAGWNDVALSAKGEQQAKDMGKRYASQSFDAIFCSDLQRSYKTAELAFGAAYPVILDKRLRECSYGDLNGAPKSTIEAEKPNRITTPFPNGESYTVATKRIGECLRSMTKAYDGKKILIIGHRATQYGLEHWLNHKPIIQAVTEPWQWQPGWHYELHV